MPLPPLPLPLPLPLPKRWFLQSHLVPPLYDVPLSYMLVGQLAFSSLVCLFIWSHLDSQQYDVPHSPLLGRLNILKNGIILLEIFNTG